MPPVQVSDHSESFAPSADQCIGEVFVRHLALFGEVDASDKETLLGLKGRIDVVHKGDAVLQTGEHPTHVVAVLGGMLQRYTLDVEGNRQVHSFYLAGDIPSLEGLHIDIMDNTLAAITMSRVALVTHADMFALLETRPKLAALCWRETLVQASIFREWLARNSIKQGHAQMAHLFCEMMTRAVANGLSDGKTMDLPLTQQDLADALGMSPVHANRTLQMLRNRNKVELRGGVLTIYDREGLAHLAGFDPAYLHLSKRQPANGGSAQVGIQRQAI